MPLLFNSTRLCFPSFVQAATIIQRYTRGWMARQSLMPLRSERAQMVRTSLTTVWERLSSNAEELSTILFRRIFAIEPKVATMFPFSKEESIKCFVSLNTRNSIDTVHTL